MTEDGRPRLSVLIITLNEERLLGQVLESVRWADEIIIVDSGSTDRTGEIARRYTTEFHYRGYAGEGEQRLHSLSLSKGEWILYIDGDEILTPQLAESIQRAISSPGDVAGYRMQLHTHFLGQWFGRRGWRKEWKIRLFRRDRGTFSPVKVHSGSVVRGKIGTLKGPLLHFPYRDLEHFVAKMNQYSSRMAAIQRQSGSGSSAWSAALRGFARFVRDFIGGGDFLYGPAGLIRSSVTGYYTFLKYAKVWEGSRLDPAEPPLLPLEPTKGPP